MIRKLQSFFSPEQFQGWNKKKRYFEGWYYKIVDPGEQYAFAIIPGISLDDKGKKHAFIQALDGKKLHSEYHRFKFSDFRPEPGRLEIRIGNNVFTEQGMELNLPGMQGSLRFTNNVPWPKPFYSPGIMGPYAFAPFMECYHGIVSMDHMIDGSLTIESQKISFKHGRGYIEKDWGRSFPSAYFWMQSNHFSTPGISVKASVAKIPWLGSSFTGFICGVWLQNRLIRFTTYNRTELLRSFADKEKVELVMQNKKYKISITASRDHATALASPILGHMEGRIEESMRAALNVQLTDIKTKEVIFEDTGKNAGLEVAGAIEEIFV